MNTSDEQGRINLQQPAAAQQPSASVHYSANSSDRDSEFEGVSDEDGSPRSNDPGQRAESLNSSDQQKDLTDEDHAAQLLIKQKNREHAKNTRARRKNYIESLKEDIQQIITTRDARESERKDALNNVAGQISRRKSVLSSWFAYRTNLETDPVKWLSILDEGFEFILPITPYRSFPPQEVADGRRKVVGVDAVIFDMISLHAMAQSAVLPHSTTSVPKVGLTYEVSQESIVAEDTLMCKWRISTENVAARGGLFDVTKQGMLLAVFTAEDKLHSLEVSFDVMAFMQQLRRAADRTVFQVVPNVIYVAPRPVAAPLPPAPTPAYQSAAPVSAESSDDQMDGGGSQSPLSSSSSGGSVNRTTASQSAPSSVTTNSAGADGSPSTSNTGSAGSSGKSDAFGAFLYAAEPRVVISAAEPYTFLYTNQIYQEVFRSDSPVSEDSAAKEPLTVFETLIRSDGSDTQALQEVLNSLRNKYPCCAILSCSAGGASSTVYPCLCTFLPLFGRTGTVEQFLVVLEAITVSSEGVAAPAVESADAVNNTATRKTARSASSSRASGDGSQSSHTGTATGGTNGVTDRESLMSSVQQAVGVGARSADDSAGAAGTSRKAGRLTSHALDTQQAEDNRRAGGAVSMHDAATQRWMYDVTDSGPAHEFTQRERASGSKMQREDRGSPQEMVAKSSRTNRHDAPVGEPHRPCSHSSFTSDGFASGTLTTSGAGSGDCAEEGNRRDSSSSDSAMLMSPAGSGAGTPPSDDLLAVEALMSSSPSEPEVSGPLDDLASTIGTTADWAEGSVLPPE